jgi:hypothetical protein
VFGRELHIVWLLNVRKNVRPYVYEKKSKFGKINALYSFNLKEYPCMEMNFWNLGMTLKPGSHWS